MKKLALLGAIFILAFIIFYKNKQADAATTINAASCSQADVQNALNQATNGDTVQIPAGTCHWTSNINYFNAPPNFTLKGAGDPNVTGGGDATVIVDDFNTDYPLLGITANSTGIFRVTGITFQGGTGVLKDSTSILAIYGPSSGVRLDHLHFNMRTYTLPDSKKSKLIAIHDRVFGVMDHSILDLYAMSAIYVYNGRGIDGLGNASWASDTNFGSSNFFFFEDNQVNGDVSTVASRLLDCYSGSRVVIRNNTLGFSGGPEVHATGHAGNDRGCRAAETYNNHYTVLPGEDQNPYGPAYDIHDASSGAALVWNNVVDNGAAKNILIFNVTRKNNDTYAQSSDGWGYCGTAFNGVGSPWDQNSNSATGYACIDQPGRGKGDLLTGLFPNKIDSTTGAIAWPNQALEPIYIWNNSGSPAPGWGGNFYSDNSGGRVVANRDYYPQSSGMQTSSTSPFNGTSGTGMGLMANRPSTCTTGVAFWATDAGGNWNTINSTSNDGALYKCSSTNTWTLYYTPYTYPHPLTAGTTTTTLQGDLNNDGIVNSLDWSIMNSKWFTSDSTADINKDGIVNSLDWSIMNANWFKTA